jgi:hypothetical protein
VGSASVLAFPCASIADFVHQECQTHFCPAFRILQEVLHEEKIIEDIHRIFCDSATDAGVTDQQPSSPPKDAVLDVGSLMAYGMVHRLRLRLRHLALVIVQVTEIVDRVQRRRMLRSQRPLLPLQRSQVHRL